MRLLIPLLLLLWTESLDAQDYRAVACQLYESYFDFRESAIKDRRFKHSEILPLIQRLQGQSAIESVRVAGRSIEGRELYVVRIGTGPTPVLLWSQMHGDEPTATMALFDIFRFFTRSGDGFDALRTQLRSQLSLYFLPMLNPDGAERYQRRNAIDIDLNRDALRLQSPEARLLKQIRDEVQAEWGFNLHDQSAYYAAGQSAKSASFSFLAPAYNYEKSVNEVRRHSMQLIAELADVLDAFIPDQVAKYDDSFEPRAFGDNMQGWGTRTILVEVGGLKGDPENQELRRIHFAMLLAAFQCIADKSYVRQPLRAYYGIPDNRRSLHSLIVRNASLSYEGQRFQIDLGFQSDEVSFSNWRQFYRVARLNDLGDLSTFHGYEELDARGMLLVPGKLYPDVVPDIQALKRLDWKRLHREGYSDIRMEKLPSYSERESLPFRVHKASTKEVNNSIRYGGNPSFFLHRDDKPVYLVVNGTAFALS